MFPFLFTEVEADTQTVCLVHLHLSFVFTFVQNVGDLTNELFRAGEAKALGCSPVQEAGAAPLARHVEKVSVDV